MDDSENNGTSAVVINDYNDFAKSIYGLVASARSQGARSVNAILTATCWEIGRRVVEFEQEGKERAEYGSALFQRLSKDLMKRFGRGFGVDNLQRMRAFYLEYKPETIYATLSRNSEEQSHQIKSRAATRIFTPKELASVFPLPWSAYVRLLSVKNNQARAFYEKDRAVAKHALEGLPNKILASEYQIALPKEKELVEELLKTRRLLELRHAVEMKDGE